MQNGMPHKEIPFHHSPYHGRYTKACKLGVADVIVFIERLIHPVVINILSIYFY
jgi:hypothetical protein